MKKTLKIINELVKKGLIKKYAIGGAIGVLKWTEPFFTRDLDIFIILKEKLPRKQIISLAPIYDYLKTKGYNKWVGQWIIIEDVPVEFIPATEGLFKEAVENSLKTKFAGIFTKIITPEYLIALFLLAGREKDRIKINMLVKQAKVNSVKLRNILNKYNLDDAFDRVVKHS